MPDMYFKQVLHEDCGCSSYIVGSHHSHEVAVIDPALGIEPYLDTSHGRHLAIKFVIDTHIHADHISGARRLAEHIGAELCLGAGADVLYQHRPLHDGDLLA